MPGGDKLGPLGALPGVFFGTSWLSRADLCSRLRLGTLFGALCGTAAFTA
jgi:hypothetical protein